MQARYQMPSTTYTDSTGRVSIYLYSETDMPSYWVIGTRGKTYDIYLYLRYKNKEECLSKYYSARFIKSIHKHKRIPNLSWFGIMLHCGTPGGIAFLDESVWYYYNKMPPKWKQRTQVMVKKWLLNTYKIKMDMKKFFRGGVSNGSPT